MAPTGSNASAVPYIAFGSGQALPAVRTTVSDSDYTVTAKDTLIAVSALSAARTITLPSISSIPRGWQIIIKDESGSCSGSNTITVSGTIDSASDLVLDSAYASATIYSNGASWSRLR